MQPPTPMPINATQLSCHGFGGITNSGRTHHSKDALPSHDYPTCWETTSSARWRTRDHPLGAPFLVHIPSHVSATEPELAHVQSLIPLDLAVPPSVEVFFVQPAIVLMRLELHLSRGHPGIGQ